MKRTSRHLAPARADGCDNSPPRASSEDGDADV
jgi:hypothetical protein